MVTSRYTLPPRRHWSSGALVCLAMFAFGGLLLWGLFRAPRAKAPPSPEVPWGVPPRAVRVVCVDVGQWARNLQGLPPLVTPFEPDFVLAHRVPGPVVVPLAEGLGMQRTYHPGNFAPLADEGEGGCLILSKHPLYDAAPLRPDPRRPAAVGVWATTVVDGRRFAVASADGGPRLSGDRFPSVPSLVAARMVDERQAAAGNPPLVAGLRAPAMLSARAEMLKRAKLAAVGDAGAGAEDGAVNEEQHTAATPLVGLAGPWRVVRPAEEVAPGIVLVELGPQ